jgi:hypothetical protein
MRDWTPELQRDIDNMNAHNGVEVEDNNEYCVECGDLMDELNTIDTEEVKGKVENWMYETCAECADAMLEDPGDNYTNKEMEDEYPSD